MKDCLRCHHPDHYGQVCGYALTEEYEDTVGFIAPPTGMRITEIVGTCSCGKWSDEAIAALDSYRSDSPFWNNQ